MPLDPQADWERLQPRLDELLDQDPGEQAARLADIGTRDPALRAELERMLASILAAEHFLEQPALELAPGLLDAMREEPGTGGDDPMAGRRIGPYEVLREIGTGGMGTVYLAARADDQYRKQVAIKLVAAGVESAEIRRRFVAERQILASLDHPNIAHLFDGGLTEAGAPYLVMEYVDGTPIDRYCDAHRLPVEARLGLFDGVCDAVQCAHQNLVVHRDLKPGNILVTADGTVKLLDFGIATLLEPSPAGGMPITEVGHRLLTPEYASPEQLGGELITTASDVYQLGVLLFELLTGARPYRFGSRSPVEVERVVRETAPARPSTATAEPAAEHRATTAGRLRRRLAGDLDSIVLRALRKEPAGRYGSVRDLQIDLQRHRDGHPVAARRGTRRYRARKFLGRHRVGTAASGAVVLLLVAAIAVTGLQATRIAAERDQTERVATFLIDMFAMADPDLSRGRTVTARDLLDRGAVRIERDLARQPEARARMMDAMGRAYVGLGLYDEARPLLESALATQRQIHRQGSAEIGTALFHLAYLLHAQDRSDSAEAMFREALAIRRTLHGDRHPDAVASLNGLAYVLRARGDYAASAGLYREALLAGRALPAGSDSLVATTLGGLAVALNGLGRFDEAEPLFREALALNRALLGNDHPHININLYSLAKLLHDKGDLAAAEPLYREAVAVGLRVFGGRHPLHALDLVGLARLLRDKGDYAEAETLYRRALEIQREALPQGHARIATTLIGLGRTLIDGRKTDEALPLLREALDIRNDALPAGHRGIAEAESLLTAHRNQ